MTLKKLILCTIFIFLLVAVSALPVSIRPNKGIKAGFASSKITGDDAADDLDSKIGFCAGFFVEIPQNQNFSFQPELCFVSRGVKQELDNIDYTYTFNYFQIPVLLKVRPMARNRATQSGPYFVGGVYLAFNTSAKVKAEYRGQEVEDDVDDMVEGTDFGFIIGGGIELNGNFCLELRYERGLTSVYDLSDYGLNDVDIFNSSVLFNLALTIR